MQIEATLDSVKDIKTQVLVLMVDDELNSPSPSPFVDLEDIKPQLRLTNFAGKLASVELLINKNAKIASELILAVGVGKKDQLNLAKIRKAFDAAMTKIQSIKAKSLVFQAFGIEDYKASFIVRLFVEVAYLKAYKFNDYKSKDTEENKLEQIFISPCCEAMTNEDHKKKLNHKIKIGTAIGKAKNKVRRLGDMPPNDCTPSYLAEQAQEVGKANDKVEVKVLGEKDILDREMNSLYAVGKGSIQESKLIVMEYKNGGEQAPVAFVGKGITFDSGGISLKPGEAMDEMKYDMLGAASVIAVMAAAAELELPLNIIGIVAAAENLPSGSANKPGDIWKTMSGLTVEVLNTDAEGRLVLCDALTYAQEYQPEVLIDIATLTGACIIALGHHATGVLANDDQLAAAILKAGKDAEDRGWQLPLWDEYQEQLKSNFADMQNIGGRAGGTITAAKFLSNFTKNVSWAHLDIAGTGWISGKSKGATGRPVGMLLQYLFDKSAS